MEKLSEELEEFIRLKASLAIVNSETYQEAINLVQMHSSMSEIEQAIKTAILDEILKRALNSKIIKDVQS